MNWYYSVGQEQKGPVTDEQLQGLAKDGIITPDTLVWREGLTEWQAYRTVLGGAPAANVTTAAPSGEARCVECGRAFPADQGVKFGTAFVCAGCKPKHVQRLQEGVATGTAMKYASFGERFAAKFIDGILGWILGSVLGFVIGLAFGGRGGANQAAAFASGGAGLIVGILYGTLFIGAYGATPGKMALKLRVVNADGSKVSYGKACGRYFAEILSSLTCLIGYIMAGFDDQHRALHDRICETRVIKRN